MYFVCECGKEFDEEQTGAPEHMLEKHLELVETRFEDFLDDAIENDEDTSDQELYEDALEDVTDELLDQFMVD